MNKTNITHQTKKMKEKFIEVFNLKLMEFFKKIISMFPNNKDFKSMRAQLRLLITNSPNSPSEYFYKHVNLKYSNYILKKDDTFFIDLDLSGTPFASLNYLKNVWVSIDDKTKNAIWEYVILLTKLSQKISLTL
jgi:hypothetical protein|tara:strand:+ start:1186 stop:1587 length:402 start_codon:yes stop_codon:yes gene_type:complete